MGLWAKVLGGLPRHEEIVARILGESHSSVLIVLIGIGEIIFGFWLLSRWKWRIACYLQILAVGVMNTLEIILAKDLLLFGIWNGLVALAFMLVTWWASRAPENSTPSGS